MQAFDALVGAVILLAVERILSRFGVLPQPRRRSSADVEGKPLRRWSSSVREVDDDSSDCSPLGTAGDSRGLFRSSPEREVARTPAQSSPGAVQRRGGSVAAKLPEGVQGVRLQQQFDAGLPNENQRVNNLQQCFDANENQGVGLQQHFDARLPNENQRVNLQQHFDARLPNENQGVGLKQYFDARLPSENRGVGLQQHFDARLPNEKQRVNLQQHFDARLPNESQRVNLQQHFDARLPNENQRVNLQQHFDARLPNENQRVNLQQHFDARLPKENQGVGLKQYFDARLPSENRGVGLQQHLGSRGAPVRLPQRSEGEGGGAQAEFPASPPAPDQLPQELTAADLRQHRCSNDCWLAFDGQIFDVTQWNSRHPGGSLARHAGMDSAAAFKAVPRHFDPSSRQRMETVLRQCFVGSVGETRAGKNAERMLHVVLG